MTGHKLARHEAQGAEWLVVLRANMGLEKIQDMTQKARMSVRGIGEKRAMDGFKTSSDACAAGHGYHVMNE